MNVLHPFRVKAYVCVCITVNFVLFLIDLVIFVFVAVFRIVSFCFINGFHFLLVSG